MRRLLILSFCFASVLLCGTDGPLEIPLPDLVNPDSICIHDNNLLITDGESISLYNLKNFSLLKKFGKKGEGPGEFKFGAGGVVKLHVHSGSDGIIVNSQNRVTFFSSDGKYIGETNVPSGFHFIRFGDQYAGYSVVNRGRILGLAVNLYNNDFGLEKEIFQKKYYVQTVEKFNLIRAGSGNKRRAHYLVYKNKLYVEGENRIHVFDTAGNPSRVIVPAHDRLRITKEQKDEVYRSLKRLFPSRLMQKIIRDNGFIPGRFPVRAFLVADDRLWIPTYERSGERTLFVVYSLTGKMAGSGWFPLQNQTLLIPYPFAIAGGKIYQLSDDEGDDWKLIVSPFQRSGK